MNSVPQTKVLKEKDRFTSAVENIVAYMLLSIETKKVLESEGRGTQQQHFRLMIESNFCHNLLQNIFKVTPATILLIQSQITSGEGWEEEVKKFADAIAPPKNLIEMPGSAQRATRGGIIIP